MCAGIVASVSAPLPSPDVKDPRCRDGRGVNIIARLVDEDFEVADDGVGSLPAAPDATRLGDLDPALAGRAHTVVDVDTKRKLGCKERVQMGGLHLGIIVHVIGMCVIHA